MKTTRYFLVLLSVITLINCGGGGSGNGNDDNVSAGGPYMLYGNGTDIYAVDTSDPTLTYLTDARIAASYAAAILITGDPDVDNTTLLNLRPDSLVYFYANKFWRIDLGAGSDLTPTQVSSANVDYICGMQTLGNRVTPADSYIFYVAAANSDDCLSNSQAYKTQAGDDSSVAPINISGAPYIRVEAIETGASPGQVTGFLVRNAGDFTVKKYDADFSSPVTLLDGTASAISFDGDNGFAGNVSFYLVDNTLYSYTHDAASGVAMHTITTGRSFDHLQAGSFRCSATHCYFVEVDNQTGIQSLYMAAIDGSGSAQVGPAFINDEISGLTRTSGRLYMTTKQSDSSQSLYAVSLPDGTPVVVDSLSGPDYFSRLFAVDEFLYYSSVNFSANSISAIARKDDNSIPVGPVADAVWAGFVSSTTRSDSASLSPSGLILAEKVTAPAAGVKYTVYETATATAKTVLGTIEGSFVGMGFGAGNWGGTYLFGLGTSIMGSALLTTPTAFQLDVFFADTATENSLYRVTNSSALNEGPLF